MLHHALTHSLTHELNTWTIRWTLRWTLRWTIQRSGRDSHPYALALKLLYLHCSYDLVTLLEPTFNLFDNWCRHKAGYGHAPSSSSSSSSLGGDGGGKGGKGNLSDEPVLHVFSTVNLLLAKCGRQCGEQLRRYGGGVSQ